MIVVIDGFGHGAAFCLVLCENIWCWLGHKTGHAVHLFYRKISQIYRYLCEIFTEFAYYTLHITDIVGLSTT